MNNDYRGMWSNGLPQGHVTTLASILKQNDNTPKALLVTALYLNYDDQYSDDTVRRASFNVRNRGIIDRARQFTEQDYPEDRVNLVIVDSSAKPHPFFKDIHHPRILYLNIPDRNMIDDSIKQQFPKAVKYIISDEEFAREGSHAHQAMEYIKELNTRQERQIPDPRLSNRPMLGAKRNFGAMAGAEHFGTPDFVLETDDDDVLGRDYVKTYAEHFWRSNPNRPDFARICNYPVYFLDHEKGSGTWGRYHMDIDNITEENGRISTKEDRPAWMKPHGGNLTQVSLREAVEKENYHPLFLEGCTHAHSWESFQKALNDFGGHAPILFRDDAVFLSRLRESRPDLKMVGIHPGKPVFFRGAHSANDGLITLTEFGKDPEGYEDAFAHLAVPAEAHSGSIRALMTVDTEEFWRRQGFTNQAIRAIGSSNRADISGKYVNKEEFREPIGLSN